MDGYMIASIVSLSAIKSSLCVEVSQQSVVAFLPPEAKPHLLLAQCPVPLYAHTHYED